jgi:transcriptional regulator with XRE-family HTH domain
VTPGIRLSLGRTLRRHRHEAGLSLEGAAKLAGLTKQGLCRVELGQGWPRLDTMLYAAQALGVCPALILLEAMEQR